MNDKVKGILMLGFVFLVACLVIGSMMYVEHAKNHPEDMMVVDTVITAKVTKLDVYGRYSSHPFYKMGLDNGMVFTINSTAWAILEKGDTVEVTIYKHPLAQNQRVVRVKKVS
jgi:hypothetical protein